MAERNKYRTVSIPTGITDEIERLIEELRYWPSVSSFVREATLEKIKVEGRYLRELREAEKDASVDGKEGV
jgi:Arc/MetJ-type ribon-helix-helix transcriptional regulator